MTGDQNRGLDRWREAAAQADPERIQRILAHIDAQADAQAPELEALRTRRNLDPLAEINAQIKAEWVILDKLYAAKAKLAGKTGGTERTGERVTFSRDEGEPGPVLNLDKMRAAAPNFAAAAALQMAVADAQDEPVWVTQGGQRIAALFGKEDAEALIRMWRKSKTPPVPEDGGE